MGGRDPDFVLLIFWAHEALALKRRRLASHLPVCFILFPKSVCLAPWFGKGDWGTASGKVVNMAVFLWVTRTPHRSLE